MGEWKPIRLAALGDIVTGKTPSKDNPEDWGDVMPFVTPSDYSSYGKYAGNSERKLSKSGIERLRKKVVPPGSILVTCIGSDMGKSVINRVPVITNQQINSISIANEEIDPDFIYYSMVGMEDELKNLGSSGSAVPLLNKGDFEQIEVNCPDLPAQRAIASVLSSLDAKIDLLHRQNKTLEAMAEALFRQWFTGQRATGEETVLGSVVNVLEAGRRPSGGVFGISSGVPSIGAESIVGLGHFDYSKTKYVPREYYESMQRGKVQDMDVLLYKDGGTPGEFEPHATMVGRGFPFSECCINEHVFRIRTEPVLPQSYLYFWLTSDATMEEMRNSGTGAAIPGLTASAVRELPILKPSAHVLEQFTNVVDPMVDRILANCRESRTLANLRDTLLPKLMSGEVRVEMEHAQMQ